MPGLCLSRSLLLSAVLLVLTPVPPALGQSGGASSIDFTEIDSLRSAGAFREAFARLSTLANRHPDAAPVHWRLALTRVDLGEESDSDRRRSSLYQQALDDARAALALDSTSAWVHFAVAVAEARLALRAGTREKVERSRAVKRHSDRAIELDSTLAAAYHVRARWNREVADLGFFSRTIVRTVYGGLPDASFEQAVRDFHTAIRLEDKVIHHLELGKTYLKMDRADEARDELRTALDMDPVDPDAPRHKKEARELLDDLD